MNCYIIGLQAIEVWLEKAPEGALLLVSKENKRNIFLSDTAENKRIPVEKATFEEISRRAGTEDHKGIALRVPAGGQMDESDLKSYLPKLPGQALVLLLEGITDTRNFGAILRSAEQFSADAVIVPKRGGAAITPEVSKTAAGADALVQIVTVVNISRAAELLKEFGFWVYGADMAGGPLPAVNLSGKTALILGSEGKGLGKNVKNHCDGLISIPTTGRLDSLNVSVAAGIFLYEIRRQQTGTPSSGAPSSGA